MINRALILLIAACALFATVIVVELMSDDAGGYASAPIATQPESATPPRAQGPRVDYLLATILGRPLFSPTRQPATRPDPPPGLDLANLKPTGTAIAPAHQLAMSP